MNSPILFAIILIKADFNTVDRGQLDGCSSLYWREFPMKIENGMVGKGVGFERIRRITGYLVGTLDRFNNGKRAEEKDRVKHDLRRE